MAEEKKTYGLTSSDTEELATINQRFYDYFSDLSRATIGYSQKNQLELDAKRNKLGRIIDKQFNTMTTFSGQDFSKFMADALRDPSTGEQTNLDRIINDDAQSFSTFFYERYKNINNKYEDLRMVTEQLCELATAVTTLRDSITSSDASMNNVSKTIVIEGVSQSRKEELENIIADIEEKYGLDAKVHDTIVPNTLTYGDFFVLHQPYNRIFSKLAYMKRENPMIYRESYSEMKRPCSVYLAESTTKLINGKKVTQIDDTGVDKEVNVIYEAYSSIIPEDNKFRKCLTKEGVKSFLLDKYANTEVINDGDMPLMEDAEISSLSDPSLLKAVVALKKRESANRRKSGVDYSKILTPDSVVNTNDIRDSNLVLPEYQDVSGIYIKMMNPLRTIPVFILDNCIGYFLLYESYGTIRNSMLQNNQLNRTNLVFQHIRNQDAATSVVDVIAQRIIDKIDNKFVKDNAKFRELMVNALMYQDLYRKDFKVQFVSAEYITHFKVNEDIETHLGTSMLRRSLFYAKLYMTYLMFKVVSSVTRSNDTRVFYVRQSGIDKDVQNQVQAAAREYKENQISFNDVASVNTLISKAGHAKDMFVATGKADIKPIDFDIISGQQVDMNTDFIEFLRKGMINGTDVPMVVMEYIDSADYARSVEMGHTKYCNKIISSQKELNVPCTEFYRSLVRMEHPEIPEDEIAAISFRFNRPKTLNIQNDSDTYSNAENAATFLVKVTCGDNTEKYSDTVKDKLFRYIITNYTLPGLFDWEDLREKAEEFITQTSEDAKKAKLLSKGDDENTSSY